MRLLQNKHVDFMRWRGVAIAASLVVILAGVLSLVLKGGPAYGIDFRGGLELHLRFDGVHDPDAVRSALATVGYAAAEIKQYGRPEEILVRIGQDRGGAESTRTMLTALEAAFPGDPPELLASNTIGAKIGQELRESALSAILFTLGLLLVYIGIRFDFRFGVGAIVALFHDVLITLGVFSLLDREISIAVLAAFLTLVGYSLNDTIVVFDRIRENLRKRHRAVVPIEQIINASINETLSRTIITGLTTLIVVVVCLLFGGEVLRDFFLCLLIGILVGTYSSIFIAAPVITLWKSGGRGGTTGRVASRSATGAVHH